MFQLDSVCDSLSVKLQNSSFPKLNVTDARMPTNCSTLHNILLLDQGGAWSGGYSGRGMVYTTVFKVLATLFQNVDAHSDQSDSLAVGHMRIH